MDVTYLDYNASTPFPPHLVGDATELLGAPSAGNPSSLHKIGRKGRKIINETQDNLAKLIGCDSEFIYWTSGASEANSWALFSACQVARAKSKNPPKILVSSIEHDSTLLASQAMASQFGAEVTKVNCLQTGQVDLNHLETLLVGHKTDLVSIMAANNETGVLQPISEISTLCDKYGTPLHMDFVQMLGKSKIELNQIKARYFTFSGHKVGAPKGVGFLVVQGEGQLLYPLIHGKQQKALRGGTENPLGIGMFGLIVKAMLKGWQPFPENLRVFHHDFEAELLRLIPETTIHGASSPRLLNTSSIGFTGITDDTLLMNLDLDGVAVSAGSACTSGSLDPSHVLLAMGCDKAMARSSIRISSGYASDWKDFKKALQLLPETVERLRSTRKFENE